MTLTKRIRYEVLRRDNFTCRYCGAKAPDVALTVDHVVPVALGGSDDPSNLVTACGPCNSGKTSTQPDAPLVADVGKDALRWAAAMTQAAEIERRSRAEDDEFFNEFFNAFIDMICETIRMPGYAVPDVVPEDGEDWRRTIRRFQRLGLDLDDLTFSFRKASSNARLSEEHVWRYFCGVTWRLLEDRQRAARALIDSDQEGG